MDQILRSPAFLMGAALLLIWGVTAVAFAGVECPEECDTLTSLAKGYYLLIGVLPGAYLVAGLLAPVRPFTTGFLLGVLHAGLLWLHWVANWPEGTTGFMSTSIQPIPGIVLLVVSLVAIGIGTVVTGWAGYVSNAVVDLIRRLAPRWWPGLA